MNTHTLKTLTATLLLLISITATAQPSKKLERLWKKGEQAYESRGYRVAVQWYEKALPLARLELGKDNPDYATILYNLARSYDVQGLNEKAEPLYIELKDLQAKALGKDHPDYAGTLNKLAYLYYKQRLYAKAEPLYIELKDLQAKALGKDHPDYVATLERLATDIYYKQRLYAKAEPLYCELKDIQDKDDPDYAFTISHLADIYREQGLYTQAEPLYLELKDIQGKDHPLYAYTLDDLADIYYEQGLYAKAEPLYLELKDSLGKDHFLYDYTLSKLADLYNEQGMYAKAEMYETLYSTWEKGWLAYLSGDYRAAIEWYEKAVTQARLELDKDDPLYATTLESLASSYYVQGMYKKAEPLLLELKDIQAKVLGKDHPDYAASLNDLAGLYSDQGLYAKAEPLFIEAKDIIAKALGKDHPDYATSLNNLALLYYNQGLYAKAEPLLLEARDIKAKALGKDHPSYATTLNNLTLLYHDQGLYAKAEPLYIEAKEIRAKALGKDHPDYAGSLNNLALLYYAQGMYKKAEPFYIEARDIYAKALGKDHPHYAGSLNNLALLYYAQGMYKKAEPLYIEARDIMAKALGKDHPDYAGSLNNLADLYRYQGLYAKAEPLYIEAIEIKAKALGKDHPDYANSLNNLASLYDKQGLYAKAEPLYMKANDILLRQIDRNFAHLSQKEKGLYLAKLYDSFERFHSFMLRSMAENPSVIAHNYRYVLATAGLLFRDQQKIKARILRSKDETLIKMYQDWQEQRIRLAKLYDMPLAKREEAGIDLPQEEAKANDMEKQISLRSEAFACTKDNTRYSWQDVQQKLKKQEAAIEMVRFRYPDGRYWTDSILYVAMVVKPDTKDQPEVIVLPNGNALEGKSFKIYRNFIIYKEDNDTLSYRQYWQPLAKHLQGVKRVYFSGEGVYHSIGLEGLLNPATGQYLGDELDIRLVAGTRQVASPPRRRSPKKEARILGYPDYNTKKEREKGIPSSNLRKDQERSSVRFFNGKDIQLLPGTLREAEQLQSIMASAQLPATVYLEGEATEANVKSWENPRIVHIATHGYFMEDPPPAKEGKDVPYENPLFRSGLLLAQAKQAVTDGGDGILTAYEAKSLNLDETELVALSACETGLGEVKNGEGVYGLQRAFRAAGAAAVLMSLWQVDDAATEELMTTFYRNWLIAGQTKREAFRNARNQLREQYPHPYYWAAFVMVGE